MKIVKISDMSEEEKKKFLEKQQERAKVKEQNKVKAQEFKNVINKSEPKDNSLPVRNNTDTAIKRTSLWEDIQNIANGSGKIADNLWQGLKNGVMSFQQTVGRAANNTQADSIDLINKMNRLALESRLKDNPEEAKQISNIINNPLISGDKIREESKEYYNKIQERKNENSLKIQQNTESISNPVGKYIAGEIAPSIGQMLPGMIGGPLGATYFIGSATGNYYDDALQRGMTENQATMYSGVMGIIEGSLEDIGAKLTTKVGKQLLKRNVKGALVSYGLDIGENFLEESVVEPISELVSSMTAGKDKANWSDIGQRMWESGVAGAVTSIITGGTSAMIGGIGSKLTQQNQYVDYNTNKKLNRDSQNWLKQAENIIQENKSSNLQQNTTNNQNITQEQQITSQENKTVQNGISEQANNNYMSAEFKKGLEKFKSGNYNQYDNIVILNETPQWLYNKGFDYEQPIVLNMDKLSTIMKEPKGNVNGKNQHGITMDIIKQLPEAISNPLNVIKNPKYNNRYVIITNLTDQYGDIVIVPIEMNTKGYIEGIRTDINRTSTVYGKENYDLPKSNEIGSYMERNKNNIVYDIDTYNNRSSNVGYRLQLPSSNITTSNNIIPPTTGIVNSNTNNSIQNAENNSISSSFDKNAKRYEDLLSANIINYNKRANGMLNVEILNNNELINQITVNSKEEAIKQLGNNIGTHIYETANEKSQILNLTQQEKVKQEPTTHKEKQLEIINTSNPMLDDYHTGIRSVEDIKAFQEVIANDESFTWGDFSKEDAEKALKKGKVTIYSSYPIEQGVFVSTSKIQAEEYAGGKGSKVYSKTVPLDEVAWINGDEGQYAKVPFRTSEEIANDTKISDLVANNQETLYNNSNESESGYNEFTNKERYREEQNSGGNQQYDKRRVQELFEKYQTGESAETSSSGQYETKKGQSTVTERQLKETLINYAEKYKKNKLNNNEQKLSNIVQKLGGNVIFYEYGKDNLFQGLSNTNTFYIDTLGNENTKNVFYHELTHFLRQNNNSIYMNEIQPIANEIATNYDYQEIIYNYAQTVSESLDVRKLNGRRQLELAEEIVADQMANFYGDLPVDYGLTDEMKTSLKNSMDKILKGTDNTANNNVPPSGNPPDTTAKTLNNNSNNDNTERTPPLTDEMKARKHYESIMKSQYTSNEAKAIAKELMGTDTYVPESNIKQLERADERIKVSGADSELNSLLGRAMTNGNIKADDIAVGERLIQYYSKTGDKIKLRDAIQATAMAGTSAGQTVQAMSLLNHQTPEGYAVWLQRSIKKMNNDLKRNRGQNAEQFNLTEDMIEKIVNSKDKVELQKNLDDVYAELGQQVSKTVWQKIDAWRYFSMLANPKTHIRNIVGNFAMSGIQYGIKNKIAGGIEAVVNKFNPDMERTHTIIPASKEVLNFAKNDINNVADRLGLNDNKYNPKSRLESNMRTFKNDVLENTVGKMFDLNDKALEAEDGWGLKAGYRKSFAEYITANNIDINNITDTQLAKARNYAVEEAKKATFHQESSLASLINQLSNKNKFAKFALDAVLPFKKTPINVAKTGIEYSPIGLVKSAIYDTVQLNKGNISVNQYIDNISKGLTGTGIALVGYALANAGILKASGSDDDDKENYDEALGYQTYSVRIGDNTYSLDWLSPSGIPLFIGAECYEIMQADNTTSTSSSDENSVYNQAITSAVNILDSFTNAMNPMTEMSMLSGLTSALKSYDQGSSQMLASLGTNAVKSYVNQFVPTAFSQIARTTDKYERNTASTKTGVLPRAIDTTKNQIMSKIPGLRQMLPTKADIWGNDIEQSDNILQRYSENAIFPWTRKGVSTTKVDDAITELYKKIGENSILPATLNKTLTINGTTYRLTNEEYSKYVKAYGETSYKLLNSLVSSNEYKNMTDSQKQTAIENVYSFAKEQNKVDYAENNGEKIETSTIYNTMKELESSNGNQSQYLNFLGQIKDIQGQNANKKKIEVLKKSNYSPITKSVIYKNTIGKDDEIYEMLKKLDSNKNIINQYLDYKLADLEADREDDGTEKGKVISGSKKQKVYNYINSIDNQKMSYVQRLYLTGVNTTLSASDKKKIFSLINENKSLTKKEKLEALDKLQGFTVYTNGTVKY